MGDKADTPVLRRKLAARRASMGLAEMTPAKAMRMSLAKAGDDALGVPVSLVDLQQDSVTPDDLQGVLPTPSLILRLEGPGGSVALAVLCPQAVAAANEALTMGKVLPGAAAERKPTNTDARMVQEFVETGLAGFALLSGDCRGLPPVDGYRVAERMGDVRVAAMVLQDAPHLHLTVGLDFASGTKTGLMHLVLPTRARSVSGGEDGEEDWSAALEKAVLGARTRLEAVLCREKLPLSRITRLEVGQVLPLASADLDNVVLRASDGRKVITARLGRSGVMRALRLQLVEGAPRRAALPQEFGGGVAAAAAVAVPDPAMPEPMSGGMDLSDPAPLDDLPGLDNLPEPGDLPGLDELPDLDTADPTPLGDLPEPQPLDIAPTPAPLDLPD
ncbi:FliM/FliN family flagellar motor switch protein [Pseudoruegeria sp. HB172150]|uniref:FliM/FliN family flagellar motor switch protein n=1 Tax=Pseudoruegeria sp. HB172150 TaxID=2721164 RepID=UPI00155737C0|nr:FliM/FliN family flagellar motor switch protein [Pseudoruegeria sp. HB172150]